MPNDKHLTHFTSVSDGELDGFEPMSPRRPQGTPKADDGNPSKPMPGWKVPGAVPNKRRNG